MSCSVVRETSPKADVDDITEPIIYDKVQHMHDLPTSTVVAPTNSIIIPLSSKIINFSDKRKQKHEDNYGTDDEARASKRSKAASGHRAPKRTENERRKCLEQDQWCTNIEPHAVHCQGCHKRIKLHPSTKYGDGEWKAHKERCDQITGVKKVRTGRITESALALVCVMFMLCAMTTNVTSAFV